MNKLIRDIILIIIYGFTLICQLSFSSFIIHEKDNLLHILTHYKNIPECKDDAIYRLKDGALIDNSIAILVSGVVIIVSFIILLINYYLSNRYNYEMLDDTSNDDKHNSIISRKLIPRERFELSINIIFILAIICFIISSGIQFVLQLNNISETCLKYIDMHINNFYIVYKFMTCTTFIVSYALFFIIPCFI